MSDRAQMPDSYDEDISHEPEYTPFPGILAELVPWESEDGELNVGKGDVVLRGGVLATIATVRQYDGSSGGRYVRVKYTGSAWEDDRPAACLVAVRRRPDGDDGDE